MSSIRKVLSYMLFPVTIWYAAGVACRNLMFAAGIKKESSLPVTTIGIGNLCTGGSGKTPLTEYLLRLLSGTYPTAFLSRGYKRKTKGFVLCSAGTPDVAQIGDEPAMVAAKFPQITIAVCEKRVEGIRQLLSAKNPPQLIVLDDVYQHRYVRPSINILLTEYTRPYFQDHILPYGNLREFRSARQRANIIIVSKCPSILNPMDKNRIRQELRALPGQKVFFSYYEYGRLVPFAGLQQGGYAVPEYPAQVLLLTGIAHPEPIQDYLVGKGCNVAIQRFADHHAFTQTELQQVAVAFGQLEGDDKIIITTEKDAVRLQEPSLRALVVALPIFILPIKVCFHNDDEADFDAIVKARVRENVIFLDHLRQYPL